MKADLTGKTILVVGANNGIGFETAKHFAEMRPERLILGCRSEEKGRDAVTRIERATKYQAELRVVDMSSFRSVLEFVEGLKDVVLDITVLNAGIVANQFEMTDDGWESTLQVNHLSTALLAFLLTPNLTQTTKSRFSAYPRLVITASSAHYSTQLGERISVSERGILETLNDEASCTQTGVQAERYRETKLLNVLFTRAFATHLLHSSPLIPTTLCPGFCHSSILRSPSFSTQALYWLFKQLLARTAEQGARQVLWAALGPDGKEGDHVRHLHGAYVMTGNVVEPSDFVISREGWKAQERLWKETVDVLAKVAPQVRDVVTEYFDKSTT